MNYSFTAQIRATEIHHATPGMTATFMVSNMPEVRYVACWTEDDGVHSCGCEHPSIADAMRCLTPDGRTFIRALEKDKDKDNGVLRSLNDDELGKFIRESMLRVLTHRRITITVRHGDHHDE